MPTLLKLDTHTHTYTLNHTHTHTHKLSLSDSLSVCLSVSLSLSVLCVSGTGAAVTGVLHYLSDSHQRWEGTSQTPTQDKDMSEQPVQAKEAILIHLCDFNSLATI